MKLIKAGAIIALALILFSGGYLAGAKTSVTKEIRIGYANSEQPERIDYPTIITDARDQGTIDNFLMVYLNSKQTEDVTVDNDHPDLYILLLSPKQSTGLIDSKVWFTAEGAIIGRRAGENWEQIDYRVINQDHADFIKEHAGYTKK